MKITPWILFDFQSIECVETLGGSAFLRLLMGSQLVDWTRPLPRDGQGQEHEEIRWIHQEGGTTETRERSYGDTDHVRETPAADSLAYYWAVWEVWPHDGETFIAKVFSQKVDQSPIEIGYPRNYNRQWSMCSQIFGHFTRILIPL